MKCIVLAGGTGDRLWPLSRRSFPKQFIRNNESLLQYSQASGHNLIGIIPGRQTNAA